MLASMMTPVLVLVCWTLIMLVWMGISRFVFGFPRAPQALRHKRTQEMVRHLPDVAAWAGDNYNHLHEQPTLFYALAVYSHLVGVHDPVNVALAWAYVGFRVLHSLVQVTRNIVIIRFALFIISSAVLIAMAVRNVLALFAG